LSISGAGDQYYSIDWSSNASLIVTANKDKTCRILDPRALKVASEFKGLEGSKG